MFNCRVTRAVFATLALAGIILLSGCGNLSRQPLGPDRTAVAQQGSSGKTFVSPKAAKAAAKKDTTSQTSVKLKGAAPSSYSLGDDLVPEAGLP